MTFIGQIELTKKKPPRVTTDERAWQDLYDTLNHLIDSVNSKKTTEMRRPGDLHNSIGDIRVFKDKTDSKYYMETMTEDGSARREMFISDKDSRSGDGFYSLAGKLEGGAGSSGSSDDRNIEQQLFEQIPWTGGIPNNVTTDADGKLVVDKVVGATVSNDNIVEANMVGSDKTWTVKPNNTTTDSDGRIVVDNVAGATVSNSNIVAANVIGSGKSFTTKPPVTFRQDAVPTSITDGDLWYDTDDGNKLYRANAVGVSSIVTSGNGWYATVDATIAVADGKAVAAQNTANSALSTANGKNVSFYQDAVPTSVAEGDMWFDTDDEYKMYRANAASVNTVVTSGNGWYVVNAVPTLAAVTISASNINAGAVTAGKIATNAVTASTIAADAITAGKIATNAITAGKIAADAITADKIATNAVTADAIEANAVTASEINVGTLSAISANMGSVTAGDINVGSGKFILESDGDAKFGDGRFFFDKAGDMYIKPLAADASGNTRRGLIFTEYLDGSGDWSDYWMQYHDSGTSADTNQMNFLYNGSNKFELTTAGLGTFATGIGFNGSGYNMQYDSGHIQVNLNAESTDGLSIYPNYHSTGSTVGHDLGKSTKKWRKIFVVQSNVGDLTMTNSDETAKWTLREQPDCILARNNITKKTFKLDMTETSDYADEEWDE